jgi:hypothetical protein
VNILIIQNARGAVSFLNFVQPIQFLIFVIAFIDVSEGGEVGTVVVFLFAFEGYLGSVT